MLQTSTERILDWTRLGGGGYPLGILQEVKIWPYCQMEHAKRMSYIKFYGILR